jgi:hypothetical protein
MSYSFHPQSSNQYTSRATAIAKLGIRSRTTLTDYCNLLGIPPGVHYFTTEEFQQLQRLRAWCKRGGRKGDYLRSKRANA